jgi:LmbE family N-acetylglucosaminyl deacetylase
LAHARGHRVTCVCLTDGAAKVTSAVRDEESRRVLAKLGGGAWLVAPAAERIPDGKLPEHLADALAFLESSVPHADEVVTLAWEGGHHDHDAAFLVAAMFAERRGIPCLEMPLYNGAGTNGGFFRVLHPLGGGWTVRPVSTREKLATMMLTRIYRSQRSTWLGLLPQMLLAPAREVTRTADLARASSPPHPGALLYERRFGYPYARFAERAAEFLRMRTGRD